MPWYAWHACCVVVAPVLQTHLLDGSLVGLLAGRLARTPVAAMTAHHSHELPSTAGGADTLVRFAHVPESKIEIVHHGFDLTRLDPSAVNGMRVRQELGLEDASVFGAIGRIYRLKNYPPSWTRSRPLCAPHPRLAW